MSENDDFEEERAWKLILTGEFHAALDLARNRSREAGSSPKWIALKAAAGAWIDEERIVVTLAEAQKQAQGHWMADYAECIRLMRQWSGHHLGRSYAKKLVEKRPDLSDSHVLLAFFEAAIGDTTKARKRFAIGIEKDDPRPWFQDVQAYIAYRSGLIGEAEAHIRLGEPDRPNSDLAEMVRVHMLIDQERFDEAIELSEDQLDRSPRYENLQRLRVLAAYYQVNWFRGWSKFATNNRGMFKLASSLALFPPMLLGIFYWFGEFRPALTYVVMATTYICVVPLWVGRFVPWSLKDRTAKALLASTYNRDLYKFAIGRAFGIWCAFEVWVFHDFWYLLIGFGAFIFLMFFSSDYKGVPVGEEAEFKSAFGAF